ncbi:hypothetical protein [Fuchsiella alkaliacetigena]|uniref:hypothetical protein n=1 Tax=Fuchsiella alkaliacetigena TaxID=957042 RepID=UPI00200AAAF6|nr:hypothetical protein [Fuchsiella alkaliacetigena]MCK8823822.1 hypothetical protein [Fuchsiella alkaliacetigena]
MFRLGVVLLILMLVLVIGVGEAATIKPLAGQELVLEIEEQRIARLEMIKEYLEELKNFVDPYKMFELKIDDEVEVRDRGAGKIEISVPKSITLKQDYYQSSVEILNRYQDYLYPDQGRVDSINRDLLAGDYRGRIVEVPVLVVFLNDREEVVAFYANYIRSRNEGLSIHIHNRSKSFHRSVMEIPEYRMPWLEDSNRSKWRKDLPEKIVSQIESVNIIFANQELFKLLFLHNYESYDENYLYGDLNSAAYIYSTFPAKLADIKLAEADVIAEIDKRIANVENKIAELKGQEAKNKVESGVVDKEKFEIKTAEDFKIYRKRLNQAYSDYLLTEAEYKKQYYQVANKYKSYLIQLYESGELNRDEYQQKIKAIPEPGLESRGVLQQLVYFMVMFLMLLI